MRSGNLLTNGFLLAVGPAICATGIAGAVEQSAEPISAASPARLDGGSLTLEAREQSAGVAISLKDSRGIEYAGGMACYRVELKNGRDHPASCGNHTAKAATTSL